MQPVHEAGTEARLAGAEAAPALRLRRDTDAGAGVWRGVDGGRNDIEDEEISVKVVSHPDYPRGYVVGVGPAARPGECSQCRAQAVAECQGCGEKFCAKHWWKHSHKTESEPCRKRQFNGPT